MLLGGGASVSASFFQIYDVKKYQNKFVTFLFLFASFKKKSLFIVFIFLCMLLEVCYCGTIKRYFILFYLKKSHLYFGSVCQIRDD